MHSPRLVAEGSSSARSPWIAGVPCTGGHESARGNAEAAVPLQRQGGECHREDREAGPWRSRTQDYFCGNDMNG
jgi:hypothetical protein